MVRHKGLDLLLPALRSLEGVRLSLVGDGPMAPALRALAARDGLDPVITFHGALPRGEAIGRLARSHVLALPSQYEGLSHTLLEACAAGVPAVASDRGGNPEVIEHGRSGLLTPYGRPEDLREALRRLRDDEDLRLCLAHGARARSRAFDVEATVAATIDLVLG
jgi:glycosyltransferase involved in cell wall biosynthesis